MWIFHFQPIIAILRPLPGTMKRKIFNWIHWAVGTGAHFLASKSPLNIPVFVFIQLLTEVTIAKI